MPESIHLQASPPAFRLPLSRSRDLPGSRCRLATAAAVLLALSAHAVGEPPTRPYVVCLSVAPERAVEAGVRTFGLTRNDFHWLKQTLSANGPAVAIRTMSSVARHGARESAASLIGCTAELGALAGVKIDQGRFLTARDIAVRDNVCVIGSHVARQLFLDESAIGKSVRIENNYFLVVGVAGPAKVKLASVGEGPQQAGGSHCVYIPLSTMRSRLGDLQVVRDRGTFQASRFELSEIWLPLRSDEDLAVVRQGLAALRESEGGAEDYRVDRRLAH